MEEVGEKVGSLRSWDLSYVSQVHANDCLGAEEIIEYPWQLGDKVGPGKGRQSHCLSILHVSVLGALSMTDDAKHCLRVHIRQLYVSDMLVLDCRMLSVP